MTALHIAADTGVRAVAESLLDYRAKEAKIDILLAKDDSGRMPLHYASSSEVAKLFVVRGAEINARHFYGATPLLEAARSNVENVILALVDKYGAPITQEILRGTDVNAKDNSGSTPLHLAVRRWIMTPQERTSTNKTVMETHRYTWRLLVDFLKAVQLLIEFRVDSRIRNHQGYTALQLATKNVGYPSATQLLATQAHYSATSSYDTADDGCDTEREKVIELLRRHRGTK
ncbi:hypothetical protein MMC26_001756 [Xylographa opegraphella]|nr:hypothetical protein [Xylographa opegraphella]